MKIKIIIVLLLIFIYSVTNILRLDWIEILELKSLDFRYRIRGDISTKTDIVILSVDENSLINFETELNEAWPWQRRYHGKAVQLLFDNGAKAVGFDISFTSNDRINIKNDTYLGSIIRKYGNVVLGTYAISDKTIYDNYSDSYKQYLFENTDYLNTKLKIKEINFRSNLIPMEKYKLIPPVKELASSSYPAIYEVGNLDVDGVLRNVPLIYKEKWAEENGFGDIFLPHMDLLLFNAFNGNYENIIDLKKLEINTSERNIKIDQNGIFQIFFYGHGPQVFETVSFYDLINGNFNKDIFKDKLVLVGFTSSSVGLYDLRITPYSTNEAGVYVHANVIQNLINNDTLIRLNFWERLIMLLFMLLLNLFFLSFKRAGLKVFSYVIPFIFLIVSYVFFLNKIWIDTFYILISLIFLTTYDTVFSFIYEYKEKQKTKSFLSKYVPDMVVNQLLKGKELNLGGSSKNIVILFSDIQGFTEKSEKLSAEQVVDFLNKYLTGMSEIIRNKYGGTIDKFIGDAIMAIWGAPVEYEDKIERALKCAIDMKKSLKELNNVLDLPFELKNGIGIHTGEAIIGNIGAPFRMDYTAIGDVINTASRVEHLTRDLSQEILVTEQVYEISKEKFIYEYMGEFQVKGKANMLKIYSLKGYYNEKL